MENNFKYINMFFSYLKYVKYFFKYRDFLNHTNLKYTILDLVVHVVNSTK